MKSLCVFLLLITAVGCSSPSLLDAGAQAGSGSGTGTGTGTGSGTALHAAGSLDTSFGTSGYVPDAFANNLTSGSIALQSDGKLVTVTTASNDIGVARYLANGTLDSTFGTVGKVLTNIGTGNDVASAVVIQPDGKIVVAGYGTLAGVGTEFALLRYNSDGTLDPAFGTGGIVTATGHSNDIFYAVAIQADGKIVALGTSYNSGMYFPWVIYRFNSDGTLDTGFANAGIGASITTAMKPSSLLIQPDGKIVVAGYNSSGLSMRRYLTDGSLDAGFGTAGTAAFTHPLGSSFGYGMVQRPDGKFLVTGYVLSSTTRAYVALVNTDGSLDPSFGTAGFANLSVGPSTSDSGQAVALQTDNKIVFAGYTYLAGTGYLPFVSRLNSDGTPDDTFGEVGIVVAPLAHSGASTYNLTIQADGKIIFAGYSFNDAGTNRFAMARFWP